MKTTKFTLSLLLLIPNLIVRSFQAAEATQEKASILEQLPQVLKYLKEFLNDGELGEFEHGPRKRYLVSGCCIEPYRPWNMYAQLILASIPDNISYSLLRKDIEAIQEWEGMPKKHVFYYLKKRGYLSETVISALIPKGKIIQIADLIYLQKIKQPQDRIFLGFSSPQIISFDDYGYIVQSYSWHWHRKCVLGVKIDYRLDCLRFSFIVPESQSEAIKYFYKYKLSNDFRKHRDPIEFLRTEKISLNKNDNVWIAQ